MNLLVIIAIISFLFLQASYRALLSCESKNAWDREYNGESVHQKCVNYRDKEQNRWYGHMFEFLMVLCSFEWATSLVAQGSCGNYERTAWKNWIDEDRDC